MRDLCIFRARLVTWVIEVSSLLWECAEFVLDWSIRHIEEQSLKFRVLAWRIAWMFRVARVSILQQAAHASTVLSPSLREKNKCMRTSCGNVIHCIPPITWSFLAPLTPLENCQRALGHWDWTGHLEVDHCLKQFVSHHVPGRVWTLFASYSSQKNCPRVFFQFERRPSCKKNQIVQYIKE